MEEELHCVNCRELVPVDNFTRVTVRDELIGDPYCEECEKAAERHVKGLAGALGWGNIANAIKLG